MWLPEGNPCQHKQSSEIIVFPISGLTGLTMVYGREKGFISQLILIGGLKHDFIVP